MRESENENFLRSECRKLGGDAVKVKWVGRRGAPDRLILLPNWGPFVELKAPGKKAQSHQRRQHDLLRAAGHIVLILDTKEKITMALNIYKQFHA